ncbi:hypothetical protein [Methylobacterium nigriterrae]|uniref:hypothetical protein n=1 Tax=Methylobacterium nigriterrae TaxID=3127512 RepID=UPI0030136ECC
MQHRGWHRHSSEDASLGRAHACRVRTGRRCGAVEESHNAQFFATTALGSGAGFGGATQSGAAMDSQVAVPSKRFFVSNSRSTRTLVETGISPSLNV